MKIFLLLVAVDAVVERRSGEAVVVAAKWLAGVEGRAGGQRCVVPGRRPAVDETVWILAEAGRRHVWNGFDDDLARLLTQFATDSVRHVHDEVASCQPKVEKMHAQRLYLHTLFLLRVYTFFLQVASSGHKIILFWLRIEYKRLA